MHLPQAAANIEISTVYRRSLLHQSKQLPTDGRSSVSDQAITCIDAPLTRTFDKDNIRTSRISTCRVAAAYS